VVEQEGDGVREDLAQQPACQVPEVLGPHPLYAVASCELRKDGVDPVAKPAEEGTPSGRGIALLAAVRREELDAPAPRQLFPRLRRVVVTVPDGDPASELQEFGHDRKLMGVGRSHREAGDNTGPADPNVHPEAVEGLPEQRVLAESRLAAEAAAAVGAGEEARGQGHRVHEREGRVVGGEREELLPEDFFDLPEVGGLAGEGGPVYLAEGGEPIGVVAAKEEADVLVGVEAQELAYDLDGEDLRVGELGRRAALANATILELVVDEAEDGHDEGAKIHESEDLLLASVGLGATERREVSLFIQPCGENLHTGLVRRATEAIERKVG
jgi:hypothetical protein